jgi:hypothetical protein
VAPLLLRGDPGHHLGLLRTRPDLEAEEAGSA